MCTINASPSGFHPPRPARQEEPVSERLPLLFRSNPNKKASCPGCLRGEGGCVSKKSRWRPRRRFESLPAFLKGTELRWPGCGGPLAFFFFNRRPSCSWFSHAAASPRDEVGQGLLETRPESRRPDADAAGSPLAEPRARSDAGREGPTDLGESPGRGFGNRRSVLVQAQEEAIRGPGLPSARLTFEAALGENPLGHNRPLWDPVRFGIQFLGSETALSLGESQPPERIPVLTSA